MQTLKHPFFLFCLVLFVLHQLSQKIFHLQLAFLDSFLDPLLCMPILLNLLLFERRLWWIKSDQYIIPLGELTIIAGALSLVFELGFPAWSPHFTGDFLDVIAYFVGGLGFHIFLNKPTKQGSILSRSTIFDEIPSHR